MTTYAFETITQSQALAIRIDDIVTFAGGSANGASVAYNIPFAGPATVTVTFRGHSVEFGLDLLDMSQNGRLKFFDDSHLVIGGTGRDVLVGISRDDALFGGDDNDTLTGQGGNDVFQGNAGNDLIIGAHGADTISGGRGDDVIRAGADAAGETGNYVNGNMGADTIDGGAGADTLLGGQDNDQIRGGDGADYISGDLGNDDLRGGAGADTQFGGAGDDRIASEGGADVIDGGAGDDRIVISGGGGANVDGGDGNDTIVAASVGRDILQGGSGADRFEFVSVGRPTEGQDDEIRDWSRSDTLSFGHFSIYAATADSYAEITAGDYASALAQAKGLMAGGKVLYVAAQVGGDVVVFADTNGSGADGAETAVVLAGRTLDYISAANIV